jgi:chemotaxis family two-component system response regulator Rcp1
VRLGYASTVQPLSPILVAEDDDDDFHFLRRAAREADITNDFLRFRDGAELTRFLEALGAANTDFAAPLLLLLDLGMPVMNGFDVLQWLQEHRTVRVRPVVLSGFYHERDIERCRSLGATDYIVKPIRSEGLASLLRQSVSLAA